MYRAGQLLSTRRRARPPAAADELHLHHETQGGLTMREGFRLVMLSAITYLAGPAEAATAQPNPAPHVLTLPAGTQISVRLGQSLDTKRDRPGTSFIAHVSAPVRYRNEVLVPPGTICRGHLVESKPSGRLKGHAVMILQLDSIALKGRTYRIETWDPALAGSGHKKRNAIFIGGG